jgi:seryl-tRNA synthetase
MGKVVGIATALLALAVIFVMVTEGRNIGALYYVFRSLPMLSQAAWATIVLISLALIVTAIWLAFSVMEERQVAQALELRLGGVRGGVQELARTQVDAEAAIHRLARSDPEDAMAALRQRLTEAERFAQVQQSRNEATDLQSRLDEIRAQQQALQSRLAPVLETRRSIERGFSELDARQKDIDRTLDELASGDDAVAVDVSLRNMLDFVRRSHVRCNDIEHAAKVVTGLKEDYTDIATRLVPFAAVDGGIASRLRDLRAAGDALMRDIEGLQQTAEGPLTERLQKFADEKSALDARVSTLNNEFSQLANLRKDVSNLFGNFHHALDVLSIARRGDNTADIDARTEELKTFIEATQSHIDEIEQKMVVFGQLKVKLGEVQSRLVPLEAEKNGVVTVIDDLRETRDGLAARIRRMEESDEGDLVTRVKKFTDSKRELEERVSMLNDQFLKLATIRKDIAGLFERLSTAVSTSAN